MLIKTRIDDSRTVLFNIRTKLPIHGAMNILMRSILEAIRGFEMVKFIRHMIVTINDSSSIKDNKGGLLIGNKYYQDGKIAYALSTFKPPTLIIYADSFFIMILKKMNYSFPNLNERYGLIQAIEQAMANNKFKKKVFKMATKITTHELTHLVQYFQGDIYKHYLPAFERYKRMQSKKLSEFKHLGPGEKMQEEVLLLLTNSARLLRKVYIEGTARLMEEFITNNTKISVKKMDELYDVAKSKALKFKSEIESRFDKLEFFLNHIKSGNYTEFYKNKFYVELKKLNKIIITGYRKYFYDIGHHVAYVLLYYRHTPQDICTMNYRKFYNSYREYMHRSNAVPVIDISGDAIFNYQELRTRGIKLINRFRKL